MLHKKGADPLSNALKISLRLDFWHYVLYNYRQEICAVLL